MAIADNNISSYSIVKLRINKPRVCFNICMRVPIYKRVIGLVDGLNF